MCASHIPATEPGTPDALCPTSDSESLTALESAERTMSGMGANLVAKAQMGAGSVATGVDKALAARPESVLVIGDADGAAGAVRDLRAAGVFTGEDADRLALAESRIAQAREVLA